jgi:hypothetical protein
VGDLPAATQASTGSVSRFPGSWEPLHTIARSLRITELEALAIAHVTISAVDRYGTYPDAIAALRLAYDGRELRAYEASPLTLRLPWPFVVELAEIAVRLARPATVRRWCDGVLSAHELGEPADLDDLVALAPQSALDAYLALDGAADAQTATGRLARDLGSRLRL